MTMPIDHPERRLLNDELHARPPEVMEAPLRISYLALLAPPELRARQSEQVADLARRFDVAPPAPDASHFSADLGRFRVKWERHAEFSRYKFIAAGNGDDPFADPAVDLVPRDWLQGLAGQTMMAANVGFLKGSDGTLDTDAIAERHFGGNVITGGHMAGGAASAVTDFRIHPDGFSRFLVLDRGLTPRQAGRTIQRLLEIDTYRMLALLALPVARALGPALDASERDLAGITAALVDASVEDESGLLDRLTRLEAEIEGRYADTLYRFAASDAYYELVRRRISELREERIQGIQTIEEFLERRLTPAMKTCQAVVGRQSSLSERVARASQLLSTRVEVTRERQTQALLASMDRRAKVQLRLQETVEGLSIAAVTYYTVGLVGYAAEGLKAAGVGLDSGLLKGFSIPIVAFLAWLGIQRIRRQVAKDEHSEE